MIQIRASALGDFFDCPARAEAKHLLGMKTPTSGKALLGTALHRSTAVYDQSTLDGAGITIDEAAGAAVDAIHKPQEDVLFDDGGSPSDLEPVAIALHKLYCTKIAPTQEYAAVEVTCDSLEITDLDIALTGTTDRVRKTADGFAISDIKTGKTAVRSDGTVKVAGAAAQLGVYELLAESASGLHITAPAQIIGLQVAKTEKGQRAGTVEVVGTRELLLGEQDSPGLLNAVATMVHSGNFYGNPRSQLCGERWCPIFKTCKWRR